MSTSASEQTIHTLDIRKQVTIAASVEVVFESILEELGPENQTPDGKSLSMKIEPRPGGRWFRDLGNDAGHLWGHVQVIKPPTLIELCGPMFMSYPATNFVQYRLADEGGRTRLEFTHRAMGLIPADHREGVVMGWEHMMQRIRALAERSSVMNHATKKETSR